MKTKLSKPFDGTETLARLLRWPSLRKKWAGSQVYITRKDMASQTYYKRQDGTGYTTDKALAGIYSFETALKDREHNHDNAIGFELAPNHNTPRGTIECRLVTKGWKSTEHSYSSKPPDWIDPLTNRSLHAHLAYMVQTERDAYARITRSLRPKIVCLCGSTRFLYAFQDANRKETLNGNIVLSIGCDTKRERSFTKETKQKLDELHKRKIDLADEVLVLNVDGYIGSSTRSEIDYARAQDKPVRWLEKPEA